MLELDRILTAADEVRELKRDAARVPRLEEDLRIAITELDRWRGEAHRLALLGRIDRRFDRRVMSLRLEMDEQFIHFSRDPRQIVQHVMHQLEGLLGDYINRIP